MGRAEMSLTPGEFYSRRARDWADSQTHCATSGTGTKLDRIRSVVVSHAIPAAPQAETSPVVDTQVTIEVNHSTATRLPIKAQGRGAAAHPGWADIRQT